MNKLFLGAIFFFALTGCSEQVLDYRNAELSNGLFYGKGNDEPFSGRVTNIPLNVLPTQSLAEMNQLARDISEDKSLANFFLAASIGSILGGNSGVAALCDAIVQDGYLNGEVNCKTTAGKLKIADINYKGGKIDGSVTLYSLKDQNENTLATAEFVSDKLHGHFKIYGQKANTLVSHTIWKIGNLDGEARIYSKDTGQLMAQGMLMGDSRQGEWKFFDPNTEKLLKKVTYKDGTIIKSQPQDGADNSSTDVSARIKDALSGPAPQPAQSTEASTGTSSSAQPFHTKQLNAAIDLMVAGRITAEGGTEYADGRRVLESDFNGDQLPDAAVLYAIESASGGNSASATLALLMGTRDGYVEYSSVATGGATNIALGIDGTIIVTLLVHGPDDPHCCPSMQTSQRYRVEGKRLLPVK